MTACFGVPTMIGVAGAGFAGVSAAQHSVAKAQKNIDRQRRALEEAEEARNRLQLDMSLLQDKESKLVHWLK